MKAINVNIQEFTEKFNQEYEFLYDNYDRVAGYDEAVDMFDTMSKNKNFAAFVGEFVKFRGDFITSDREAAAFMFALEDVA